MITSDCYLFEQLEQRGIRPKTNLYANIPNKIRAKRQYPINLFYQ